MSRKKKNEMVDAGLDSLTEKIFEVKAIEDNINIMIDLFEKATQWKVLNKPFKLEINDRYR